MPKFAKRFLIVLAILVAVGALILLCINLYLQSGGVQQRLHDAIVRSLGVDVEMHSPSFTPWSGLVVRDLRVLNPAVDGENLIEAKAIHLQFAFLPLFQHRFIVTDCVLSEPRLFIRQVEGGNWVIPLPAKSAPAPKAPAEPAAPKASGPVFHAELQRFHLNKGYVTFIDFKQRIVLLLEKAEIDAEIAPDLTATGTIDISRADVAGYLKPRKVNSPFTWNGSVLDLSQINGALAGGKINGNARIVASPKPSFALAINLDNVELKKLADDAGLSTGKTEGRLEGSLQLTGDPRTSDPTTGSGHFELLQAQLKPVDFLSQVGQMLQIEELQLLKLKEAKIDLTIRDERVWIDNLLLKSENLALHGTGPVRFNGKMQLAAQLLINRKLQQQLKALLSKNFVESDDPEYRKLDFTVTGRLQNPKTDLLTKLTGINFGQDVSGILKDIFRAIPNSKAKPAEEEKTDDNNN